MLCVLWLWPSQEEAESQLPGMPSEQPPLGAASRKGVHFADSVRRVEDEPCAARVGGLTTPVLVVMLASLAYLAQTLQVWQRMGRVSIDAAACLMLDGCQVPQPRIP